MSHYAAGEVEWEVFPDVQVQGMKASAIAGAINYVKLEHRAWSTVSHFSELKGGMIDSTLSLTPPAETFKEGLPCTATAL